MSARRTWPCEWRNRITTFDRKLGSKGSRSLFTAREKAFKKVSTTVIEIIYWFLFDNTGGCVYIDWPCTKSWFILIDLAPSHGLYCIRRRFDNRTEIIVSYCLYRIACTWTEPKEVVIKVRKPIYNVLHVLYEGQRFIHDEIHLPWEYCSCAT